MKIALITSQERYYLIMKFLKKAFLTTVFTLCAVTYANAGVVIGGTRVIYNGGKKESSLSVNNPDSVSYLIQSWIDIPTGHTEKSPFIITPPLYRLDQGQQNVMRIVRAGSVAEDKESMYWLNIKAIPSSEKKENTLQIAVKTRIKLIYRPESLNEHVPEDLADKLIWHKAGRLISVTNPTSYYMNFNEITLNGQKIPNVTYVAPGQSAQFTLPENVVGGQVTFKIISDFGGAGGAHHASV